MSRSLFNRTLAVPAPVKHVSPKADARPVRIERTKFGVRFYEAFTNEEISKAEAVAMMRAYKHGLKPEPSQPREPKAPRKARVERPWIVAIYRTDLATRKSETLAEVKAETFLAAATKLASFCMQYVSDERSAVEVKIEQVA